MIVNQLTQCMLYKLAYYFGGATETRTQKPAFTDRRISNPLQYHYGTAPYLAPRSGLEPLTHGLTVRCYYQLSYQGINLLMSVWW